MTQSLQTRFQFMVAAVKGYWDKIKRPKITFIELHRDTCDYYDEYEDYFETDSILLWSCLPDDPQRAIYKESYINSYGEALEYCTSVRLYVNRYLIFSDIYTVKPDEVSYYLRSGGVEELILEHFGV